MKHKETMVFTPDDIKEALLWLCRGHKRDVDIEITCPYSLNNVSDLEAIVSWEDDE